METFEATVMTNPPAGSMVVPVKCRPRDRGADTARGGKVEMVWDKRYRQLNEGEAIMAGDEVDMSRDGWRDDPKWVATTCAGELAPDPRYASHRVYRRKITEQTND
jgi:hypothetical protein